MEGQFATKRAAAWYSLRKFVSYPNRQFHVALGAIVKKVDRGGYLQVGIHFYCDPLCEVDAYIIWSSVGTWGGSCSFVVFPCTGFFGIHPTSNTYKGPYLSGGVQEVVLY